MSDTRSLFDDPPDEFIPAPDRTEPVVWVRRLVIVEGRDSIIEPIREVVFRRGLNIIDTAQPRERVDGPVGHNVGKTLLTRLIRHCLGEQNYAREPVRDAIAMVFPDAFVVAEVFVNGSCWVVKRPIGAVRSGEAGCVQADDWRTIFGKENKQRLSQLIEVIERATVASFAGVLLPYQNRAARWLDLLAWISRDQYCRYRHALEWRTSSTDSGTADLHDEDASVLIRLVMDLLDEDETQLIRRHKQLLSDKSRKTTDVDS